MGTKRNVVVALGIALLIAACGDDGETRARNSGDLFARLGEPVPFATDEQRAAFERGRRVALRRFTDRSGLGPNFNQVSCGGCHEKPVLGGGAPRYRNFLLVRQILPDGSFVDMGSNGVQQQFTLKPGGRVPTDEGTNLVANRNPIPFFGVGLLAEIPEEEILRHADENDLDGDGISGRANFDRGFVGRFGVKAQTVSIEGFIRGPLFNHLGITTNPLSEESKARLPVPSSSPVSRNTRPRNTVFPRQVAPPSAPLRDNDSVPDPELSESDLFDLVSFAMLLAPPRPDPPTPVTRAGEQRFAEIGCANCHIPALQGPRGPVPAYTDLLLHDMGSELADGIEMGLASGSEFRTQPLWGVAAVGPYLHDGRADTLDEAIRLHGGEAASSRDAYLRLDDTARAEIIAFLESLGGKAERSEGLLPPHAPLPGVGELGGPARPLSEAERDLFLRGRAIFDRDIAITGGLGPLFNGDSCRACHFDPVIGGAGTTDVDVIRYGHLHNGMFTPPSQGTVAHRHSIDGTRPPIDETANTFETRQTPPLFGLGFLESIPDADILANDNCNDPDPQAISGCARILPSGAVGRFGWKASIPNLVEFARDALSNEVGITLPDIPGQTFGTLSDSDSVPDPEISQEDLEALVFFLRNLAPPAPQSRNPAAEAAGAFLFDAIGCTSCHTTNFVTPEGIVAYTDLLLHQVAPDGSPGIGDDDVGPLEFRTPPLWGLSRTAPYMHDGRSFTIEDAIARHEAEAAAARSAYEALTAEERANVLAFLGSL